MKAFKKLLSLLLACAMALTLLTACGGGSGGGSTTVVTLETSKTADLLEKIIAREFYTSVEFSLESGSVSTTYKPTIAVSGDNLYFSMGSVKGWLDSQYSYAPGNQYSYSYYGNEITGDDEILIKEPASENELSEILNSMKSMSISSVLSEIDDFSYGNKEKGGVTYYSETISLNAVIDGETFPSTATIYYAGDKPQYITVTAEVEGVEYSFTIKVNEFTTSFDKSILDPTNYYDSDKIITYEEWLESAEEEIGYYDNDYDDNYWF